MLEAVDTCLGNAHTLNEWRYLLHSSFDSLRPFLSPTGRQSTAWCCPYNGHKQEIVAKQDSKTANSSNKCHSCVPEINISPEDLALWEFCPFAFGQHLCSCLGLHSTPKVLEGEILHLGSLAFRAALLPAFLLNRRIDGYQAYAQSLITRHTDSCLFFTPLYCPDTAEYLSNTQHGYFPLEDLLLPGSLDPSPAYWLELQKFKSKLPGILPRPSRDVFISPDFKRINYSDGYILNLAKAHKRRAVVRFIHEQVQRSGEPEFYVEVMREAYNKQHPEHPWDSDRIREDLFKRNLADFDRLFETLDAANGRYRLKI